MKTISLFFYVILFVACKSTDNEENKLKRDDTVKIISSILSGQEFLKENLNVDTLFFLKNKLFNESLLKTTSRFKVEPLEDNTRTRMTNIGPGFPYDRRQRLNLFKFDYKNDTVKIGMYEHGGHLFYETELVLKKGNWVILKQSASSGGRMEKFEFEDEEWYKELKKKIKPHKPVFPAKEQTSN